MKKRDDGSNLLANRHLVDFSRIDISLLCLCLIIHSIILSHKTHHNEGERETAIQAVFKNSKVALPQTFPSSSSRTPTNVGNVRVDAFARSEECTYRELQQNRE